MGIRRQKIHRLKKELARVTEERDILKTIPGRRLPVRDRNGPCYARPRREAAVSLLVGSTPLKNVAHGFISSTSAISGPSALSQGTMGRPVCWRELSALRARA